MASTGGNMKGNIGGGGVVNSQTGSIASQPQIVTSQSNQTASMIGGQMQIISPLQVAANFQERLSWDPHHILCFLLVFTNGAAFWFTTSRLGMGNAWRPSPAHIADPKSNFHSRASARRNDLSSFHSADKSHSNRCDFYLYRLLA